MKLRGGLAWLAACIIFTHTVMIRDTFDSPHIAHEYRSLLELNSALSSCGFSVTGNFMGHSPRLKKLAQIDSLSFDCEIFSRDDYDISTGWSA